MQLWTQSVYSLRSRANAMRKMVQVGLRDPEMRQVAFAVAAGDVWTLQEFARKHGYRPLDLSGLHECGGWDERCELRNLFTFIKSNVRYTGEISGVDTYVSARRTIFEFRGGDCDDQLVALATLGIHNGFGSLARCVAGEGSRTASGVPVIGHVYYVALVPKFAPREGVALDTTMVGGAIGDEPNVIAQVDFRLD